MKTITFEQWLKEYKPINNPFIKDGIRFETYREEFEFIRKQNYLQVWTEIDSEDEETWIISGYHIINRSCYYITEKLRKIDEEGIQVNCNKMISIKDAILACYNFLLEIGINVAILKVSKYFEKTKEKFISVGKAKYMAIEFYEDTFETELKSEQEDKIHEFYSELI